MDFISEVVRILASQAEDNAVLVTIALVTLLSCGLGIKLFRERIKSLENERDAQMNISQVSLDLAAEQRKSRVIDLKERNEQISELKSKIDGIRKSRVEELEEIIRRVEELEQEAEERRASLLVEIREKDGQMKELGREVVEPRLSGADESEAMKEDLGRVDDGYGAINISRRSFTQDSNPTGRIRRAGNSRFDLNLHLQPPMGWDDSSGYYHLFELGRYLGQIGEYELAIRWLDVSIHFDCKFAESFVERGVVFFNVEKYLEALKDFVHAKDLGLETCEVYLFMGRARRKIGEYDLALKDLQSAVKLDPSDSDAYVQRGLTHLKLECYDEAIADFDKAINLNPNLVEAHRFKAKAFHLGGCVDRAADEYNEAIEMELAQD